LAREARAIIIHFDRTLAAELHSLANGRFDLASTREGLPETACGFKVQREASSDVDPSIWLKHRPVVLEST
jgi:hypothetical protein